jgi:hypothetical protein
MIVNVQLEKMWKEAVIAGCGISSQNYLQDTGRNHKKSQSGYPAFGPRIETGISLIRSRSADH